MQAGQRDTASVAGSSLAFHAHAILQTQQLSTRAASGLHAISAPLDTLSRPRDGAQQVPERAHCSDVMPQLPEGAVSRRSGTLLRADTAVPTGTSQQLVPQLLLGRVPSNSHGAGTSSGSSGRGLRTEPIVAALQQAIGRARCCKLQGEDTLTIGEPLGRGGYGSVFRGTWHKRPAAFKIMHARSSDSEVVSDAMEMAVLTSVQHPNIVAVYACLTDMVCAPGAQDAAAPRRPVGAACPAPVRTADCCPS